MKKIIPVFGMLIISGISLTTATYAWFSMNTSVKATNMQVVTKTNGTYLQIQNEDRKSSDDSGNVATAKSTTANLYPAKVTSAGADTWQYAFAKEYTSATYDTKYGYMNVAADKKNDYRLLNKFYVSSKDSNNLPTNLRVESYKVTGTSQFLDAVNIIVVCGEKVQELSAHGKESGKINSVNDAVNLVDKVTVTEIELLVYIYLDGDNDVITSSNASLSDNLTGISVEIVFAVDSPVAN